MSDRKSQRSSKSNRTRSRSSSSNKAGSSTPSRKSRSPRKSGAKNKSRTRRSTSSSSSEPHGSTERFSKSSLSNLDFPVARVKSMMKVYNHGLRVSDKSAVFATAVLQYLTTEILELSTTAAREEGLSRIQTRHVNRAIKLDPELARNFKNSSIPRSKFISLNEMINSWQELPHRRPGREQPSISTAGPSTSTAGPSTSKSAKTVPKGILKKNRREG